MFLKRIVRAVQVDPQLYSEVASDKSVLGQAMIIAVLSSIATGVGNAAGFPEKIPYLAMSAFLGLIVWAGSIYILGAKLFPEKGTKADILALLRVAGFASAPALLRLLAYLPPFTVIVSAGAIIWMFGTMVIAVQQAFCYRNISRAFGVVIIGGLIYQWVLFQV